MVRAALALAVSGLLGCVPLPVQVASPAQGIVVDAATGVPVPGSLVLVRFESRYDQVLPERRALGQREAWSGADGRFRVEGLVRADFAAWPWLITEARAITVPKPGYRCGPPRRLPPAGEARIELVRAESRAAWRSSCARISELWEIAERSEPIRAALAEMGLAPAPARELTGADERTLAARAALGFGANCHGPIVDVALAPDGTRAAFVVETPSGLDVFVTRLDEAATRGPRLVARSLAPDELGLGGIPGLELSSGPRSAIPASIDALAAPAAARSTRLPSEREPLSWIEAEDRNDEGDARWLGRSFAMSRELAPDTGLPRDLLHVTMPDGSTRRLSLPGEACSLRGRFGRPHYRITADGRFGLDLRFVDGGCHALRIDLESGAWSRLDRDDRRARCRDRRRVPPAQLGFAVRTYVRDLQSRLADAEADAAAAYTLVIASGGATTIETRTLDGAGRRISAHPFPLTTPLRRIEVSVVGPAR